MKISGTRSQIVALPADEPLADAAENPNATRPIVTLEVETDEGVVGVGVTYFGGSLTGTLERGRRTRRTDCWRRSVSRRGGRREIAGRRRFGRARRHLPSGAVGTRH